MIHLGTVMGRWVNIEESSEREGKKIYHWKREKFVGYRVESRSDSQLLERRVKG